MSATPKADMAYLFNHLVGTRDQVRRYGQAERRGGLKIDGDCHFGRHWTGKSAGLSPFRMRSTYRRATILIVHFGFIGYQTAVGNEEPAEVDRRRFCSAASAMIRCRKIAGARSASRSGRHSSCLQMQLWRAPSPRCCVHRSNSPPY